MQKKRQEIHKKPEKKSNPQRQYDKHKVSVLTRFYPHRSRV